MKMLSPIQADKRRTVRRGFATLEFALVLPVLLLLFVVINGFGNTQIARGQTIIVSKNKAWKARYGNLAPEEGANATDLGSFVSASAAGEVNPGRSRGFHEQPLKIAPFLRPADGKAKRSHFVLGGAYDHRNIRFDDGSPLVPSGRVLHFVGATMSSLFNSLDSLDSLLAAVTGGGGGGLDFFEQAIGNINKRLDKIKGSIKNITDSAEDFVDSLEIPYIGAIPAAFDLAGTIISETVNIAGEVAGLTGNVSQLASKLGVNVDTNKLTEALNLPNFSKLLSEARSLITSPGDLVENFEKLADTPNQINQMFQYFAKIY